MGMSDHSAGGQQGLVSPEHPEGAKHFTYSS